MMKIIKFQVVCGRLDAQVSIIVAFWSCPILKSPPSEIRCASFRLSERIVIGVQVIRRHHMPVA
jgi:hypothetical protein